MARQCVSTIMGVVAFVFFILSVGGSHAATRELSKEEKKTIEDAIKETLLDPESARFKWLEYVEGKNIYCGYVNSKNRYGGYVGDTLFQAFIVSVPKGVVAAVVGIGSGDPSSPESRALQQTCAGHGYRF